MFTLEMDLNKKTYYNHFYNILINNKVIAVA